MGLIPQHIIDEVIGRSDIVDVVSNYVTLKQAGRNYKALSPFNNEKTPSFIVSPDKQIFHCFSSGIGGNVVNFIMKMEHLSFPEAIRFLADKVGVSILEIRSTTESQDNIRKSILKINEMTVEYYHKHLISDKSSAAQKARDYLLKQRNVSLEIIEQFQIGFALDQWDGLLEHLKDKDINLRLMEQAGLIIPKKQRDGYFDCFRNRIIFPIFDTQGHCRAFGARTLEKDNPAKYINSPETAIYTKGHHLYGFHLARESVVKNDFIIMVEGYVDCITTVQAGIKNIVASLGTALTVEQVRLIRRYTKNVIMLYDSDKAGEAAMMRSFDMLIEQGMNVKVTSLAQGEDPDSFIRQYGVKDFANRINASKTIFDYKLNVLMKKHNNANTIEEKVAIASQMLPTIKKISNEVLRSGYIQKLSKVLIVSEEALNMELKKISDKDGFLSNEVGSSDKSMGLLQEKFNNIELNILKSLLEENKFIPMIKNEVNLEDFKDQRIRAVISKIYNLFEEGKEIKTSSLINDFEDQEIQQIISRVLVDDQNGLGNKEKWHRDIIARFKNDRSKRYRQELLQQIREAEASGDQERLEQLKKRFNQSIKN